MSESQRSATDRHDDNSNQLENTFAESRELDFHRDSQSATDSQIRQANALAKSSQELDLLEKRLLLIAMSRIQSTDTELLTHRIYMHELTEVFGQNPYARAKRAAEGLLRRVVHVAKGNNSYDQFQWTTLARYVSSASSDNGESYIEIRLNEELSPYLLELRDRYNVIPLLDVLPLQSFNAQRLYEILWHDSHAMRKQFLTYDIPDLKWELGLRVRKTERGKTVWVEKYRNWRDFRKLLMRAQDDFEEHGRLRFEFEPITHGRVTRQVRFRLSLKPDSSLPGGLGDVDRDPEEQRLAAELFNLGYSQDPYRLISEHGSEVVEHAISMGRKAQEASRNTRSPLTNLAGFIRHLLTSGMARDALQATRSGAAEVIDPRVVAQTILESFDSHRKDALSRLWDELPEDVRDRTPALLRLDLERNNSFLHATLERSGWEGPSYESALNNYLLRNHSDSLEPDVLDVIAYVEARGYLKDLNRSVRTEVLKILEQERD